MDLEKLQEQADSDLKINDTELDLESLKAGTGYNIKYPQRVVQASLSLLKETQLRPTDMD